MPQAPVFIPPDPDTLSRLSELLPITKTGRLSDKKKMSRLTRDEAKALTREVLNRTHHLWLLLERAHEGQAAAVLGYNNWRDYTTRELDMSESRSFQLIDTARIMRQLHAAGWDVCAIEPIPARVVAKLKHHPSEVQGAAAEALEKGEDIHDAMRALAQRLSPTPPRVNTRSPQGEHEQVCPTCNGQGIVPALQARLLLQWMNSLDK